MAAGDQSPIRHGLDAGELAELNRIARARDLTLKQLVTKKLREVIKRGR